MATRLNLATVVTAAMLVATAAVNSADAQSYIPADCAGAVSAQTTLHFDHDEHRRWYRRFWNGDCSGLGFLCQAQPNWTQSIQSIAMRFDTRNRRALVSKACSIGELVGHEWARDNSVRRIDTNDLRRYGNALDSSTNLAGTLDQIEADARAKLARR